MIICLRKTLVSTPRLDLFLSVSSLLRLREWHSRDSLLSVLGLHRDRHCLLHFYWYLRTAQTQEPGLAL